MSYGSESLVSVRPSTGTISQRRLTVQVVAADPMDQVALDQTARAESDAQLVASVAPEQAETALLRHSPDVVVLRLSPHEGVMVRPPTSMKRIPGQVFLLLPAGSSHMPSRSRNRESEREMVLFRMLLRCLAQWRDNTNPAIGNDAERMSLGQLTSREREILTLTAEGYSIKSIARQLHRAYGTIVRHRANIMSKLKLRDRVALTRFAIRHGFIQA